MDAEWSWQAAAITAPFGQAGRIGVNHDQPSQATMLYVHRLDSNNVDRTGVLVRLTRHDRIYLQQKTIGSSWHRYEVTGRGTVSGDCWMIPVSTDVGSPPGSPAEPPNATPLLVSMPSTP